MQDASIHICQCRVCRDEQAHPDRLIHRRMNLLLSRMDEQQRRWYVALESMRVGHGGDAFLHQITGMDVQTIRRGRQELENDLRDRPHNRVRLEGGGRPPVEEKIPLSRPISPSWSKTTPAAIR
jgi:hypothetical protein